MNILCLHGYGESGALFQQQTLPLQKAILARFPGTTFHFPNGPFHATRTSPSTPTPTSTPSTSSTTYTWLPDTLTRGQPHPPTREEHAGILTAWTHLSQLLQRTPTPYDGILAFSQGASVAVVLAGALEPHRRGLLPEAVTRILSPPAGSAHPALRFVVNISGFRAPEGVLGVREACEPRVRTPVVHVLGRVDDHLGEEEMWGVVRVCEGGEEGEGEEGRVVWWDGGHYVPGKKATVARIVGALEGIVGEGGEGEEGGW